jgi:hypothetical protein
MYTGSGSLFLSDCVIGLECTSVAKASTLVERIHENWEFVRGAWVGSCAPYTTLKRLRRILLALGVKTT